MYNRQPAYLHERAWLAALVVQSRHETIKFAHLITPRSTTRTPAMYTAVRASSGRAFAHVFDPRRCVGARIMYHEKDVNTHVFPVLGTE